MKVTDQDQHLSWPPLQVLGNRISAIYQHTVRVRNRKEAENNLKDNLSCRRVSINDEKFLLNKKWYVYLYLIQKKINREFSLIAWITTF